MNYKQYEKGKLDSPLNDEIEMITFDDDIDISTSPETSHNKSIITDDTLQ